MAEHLLAFPRAGSADSAFHELTRRGPASPLTVRALDRYVEVRLSVSEPKDRDALNEAIYGCLRVAAYATAERAARRLVELDGQNPLYLDTLAEVLHLRGDRTQAMALSTRAVSAFDRQPSGESPELRAVLLKNQARFARAAHELPTELLGEEEELAPWERSADSGHPRP
jgi:predicted Zn-dependent protease